MRRIFQVGVAACLVLGTMSIPVSPSQAAAPKPGTVCKTLGQKVVSAKLTYTCTKSGTKLIWSKGYRLPLRLITKTLPAAVAGDSYRSTIEVTGGTGYHFCDLQKGSVLPLGYLINRKTCIITGVGEILPPGTTRRISPPFTIVISDSTSPKPAYVRITLTITTYPPKFNMTVNTNIGRCKLTKECNLLVASATGGTPPYSFRKGTGIAPLGLLVETVGNSAYLMGIAGATGTYQFDICAHDLVASDICKEVSITVDMIPTFNVRISKGGDGAGRVTNESLIIDCGDRCFGIYVPDSRLTLTALPDTGSTFMGWAGDCTGTGQCTLDMNSDKVVTATFSRNSTGTYSGTAMWPDVGSSISDVCSAKPYTFTLTINEDPGGKITGGGEYTFTGTRNGSAITVIVDILFGPRGPYVWQWNGNTLSGILPAYCYYMNPLKLIKESTFTFNFARTS